MAPSSRSGVQAGIRETAGLDTGKLVLYVALLLLLLLGGDILRRVLRMVRPTTAAVAAARRDETAPVHRQTTRVRMQTTRQAVAPRRDRPSDHFLAEIAAHTRPSTAQTFSTDESRPGSAPPDDTSILAEMGLSGALRDLAAQQFMALSHPIEGPGHLASEQRPSAEALDELRREGAIIR